ncbi:catalase [Sorangium sp. So ce185]|uniref:catalase n=1 Tax=Sorangium sp. So ce185 TaxID=3133287 RepID=UPI003F5EA912
MRRSRLLPGVRAADEVHEGQVWDEAQKLAGKDPDFHRRDLWEAIETGDHSSTPSDGTATGAGKTSRPSPPDAGGRRAGWKAACRPEGALRGRKAACRPEGAARGWKSPGEAGKARVSRKAPRGAGAVGQRRAARPSWPIRRAGACFSI